MAKAKVKNIKEVKNDYVHKLDADEIEKCPICKKWMTFCLSEPKDGDNIKITEKWYIAKQDFWDKNFNHLEQQGYSYISSISKALDCVKVEKQNDLEGCLLVVKVGSDAKPASPSDISQAHNLMNEILEGVKGVRVIVTQHTFNIEKISLPQLRSIQSSVLSSTDHDDTEGSIINDLEV